MNSTAYSKIIKKKANEMGFLFCGISKATFLENEAPRLEKWLNENRHGKMGYMENHFDKRLDPRLLVEGARSVISLALNYYTDLKQTDPLAPKLSMYAYGKDYHQVIKEKLRILLEFIREKIGEVDGRAFVDSAPVMDKAWAERSGLGWRGKHTNLINKKAGSYFFLAELIVDLDLDADEAVADHCGKCTRCIDSCPTAAITEAYILDASKCISYLTIELKDEIPAEFSGMLDNNMFGCDICQHVCPWNKFSTPHNEPGFDASEGLLEMNKHDWDEITQEVFTKIFTHSAVKRTKYTGLKRNLEFLKKSL